MTGPERCPSCGQYCCICRLEWIDGGPIPAEVIDLLQQGVLPEQIMTDEWDGNPCLRRVAS